MISNINRSKIIHLPENQIKKTLRKQGKKYFGNSMIIYDNGGNLLAKYETACVKNNYHIKVLNLIDITKRKVTIPDPVFRAWLKRNHI